MRTTNEIKQDILALVREYSESEQSEKKPFHPGQRIPYCSRVYDAEERINLVDSALEFWLTAGRFCEEFEREFAKCLGVEHVAARKSIFNTPMGNNLQTSSQDEPKGCEPRGGEKMRTKPHRQNSLNFGGTEVF